MIKYDFQPGMMVSVGDKTYAISYEFSDGIDMGASDLIEYGKTGEIISATVGCFLPENTEEATVKTVGGTTVPADITAAWDGKWYIYKIVFSMPSSDVVISNH